MKLMSVPQDVVLTVLSDWLGRLEEYSALDVAFTTHEDRGYFLSLLQHPTFRLRTFSWEERDAYHEHYEFNSTLYEFLLWVTTRHIKVKEIRVNIKTILQTSLKRGLIVPSVEVLSFVGYVETPLPSRTLKSFMTMFPNVTKLICDGWQDMAAEELLALASVTEVKALTIDDRMGMDEAHYKMLFHLLKDTLESVEFAVPLTDGLLPSLLKCSQLRWLLVTSERLSPQAVLTLCGQLSKLERLHLEDWSSTIFPTDALISIARSTPHLRHFNVSCRMSCHDFLLDLLECCPCIESFDCPEFTLGVTGSAENQTGILKLLSDTCPSVFLSETFTLPICRLIMSVAKPTAEYTHSLIAKFGPDLQDLTVQGCFELPLLSHCPALRNLGLFFTNKCRVVGAVPVDCPRLEQLLLAADRVTEKSLMQLLGQFGKAGGGITDLEFHLCSHFDIQTLRFALKTFPQLRRISMEKNAIYFRKLYEEIMDNRAMDNLRVLMHPDLYYQVLQTALEEGTTSILHRLGMVNSCLSLFNGVFHLDDPSL